MTKPSNARASRRAAPTGLQPIAARGETSIEVRGHRYRMALTLGAMSQIEHSLGIDSFADITKKLARPTGRDIAAIIQALVASVDGQEEITLEDVLRWPMNLQAAVEAVYATMNASGGETDEEADAKGKAAS